MQAIKLNYLMAACLLATTAITVPVLAQTETEATSQSDAITSKVRSDKNTLQDLEQRLQPFLQADNALAQYHAQKAQMWLTYAQHEHSEGSLTKAAQQAQAQAVQLIEQLEQQQPISTTTPIIQSSKVMRRDLWANAELLKQHAGFDCAPTQIAQAEVMLVWAAAEHCELGWRHSRELFAAAERLVDQASYQVLSCHGATNQTLPKVSYASLEQLNGTEKGCHGVIGHWPIIASANTQPVEQAIRAPMISMPMVAATDVIPNVVHFALDSAKLSQASQHVLQNIAQVLVNNNDYSVTLYGHTDSRGSANYNLALGQRRANRIETYLINKGINANRIATVSVGEQQKIDNEDAIQGYALSRRVALVYATPDGQEISSVSQTMDLQPER